MKKRALIKLGGLLAKDPAVLDQAFEEIKFLRRDWDFALVHGGGKEVSALSAKLGIEAVFQDGIRVTRPEEMDIVAGVLSGMVNGSVVRHGQKMGLPTVGLSGYDQRIFTGEAIAIEGYPGSRTGRITETNAIFLAHLLRGGAIPVLSSISMDQEGKALNINADEAALAVGESLHVDVLVYVSDIPGLLWDDEVRRQVDPQDFEAGKAAGIITGGMIPKVQSSLTGLRKGIGRVVIGGYENPGDLGALMTGQIGTNLVLDKGVKS
jgi:acetylglutamate kinase